MMAYTTITFEHPETNAVRVAPVGFSWTVLFFSFFPAFIRSDWKYGIIMCAAAFISLGWSTFVFMFIYNRLYIEELVDQGYLVIDTPYPDIDVLRGRLRLDLTTMVEAAPPRREPQQRRAEQHSPPPVPEQEPAEPAPRPARPRRPRPTSNVPRIPLLSDVEEEETAKPDPDAGPGT